MMNRSLFVFVALMVSPIFGWNYTVYKTCEQTPFCSKFRTASPSDSEKYVVNLKSLKMQDGGAVLLAVENSVTTINMSIYGLDDNKFRIVFDDVNRYKLQNSLAEEPKINPIKFSKTNDDGSMTIKISENDVNSVVIRTPLTVEFYHKGQLETTFNGERLFMEDTEDSQAFAFGIDFANCSRMYGLHEHADHMALQHTADLSMDPYILKNSDLYVHKINATYAMYGAIPVLYGHGALTSGVFIHNAAQQWVDVDNEKKSAYFMVESGTLDVFVMLGPTIDKTIRQYANLTGTAHLPQLWALGYHQSRFAYMSQIEVMEVIDQFDSHNFPLDVIWLDFNHTNLGRYFTFNAKNYSDPIGLQNNMSLTNRKLVTLSDCHIKVDKSYDLFNTALEKDYLVRNADGTPYINTCWPGEAMWWDFLNPEARDFYSDLYLYENYVGSTPTLGGIWNDMNEPANFDESTGLTMPFDNLHYGNVSHRDIHNIYGLLQVTSTHKGLFARDNGTKRPFILSRSHFAGSQRYTAMWTGDNSSEWPFIAISFAMCLTSNILGMPFCGADIPGFEGEPTEDLVTRWYQASIWLPFMRSHCNINLKHRREPYYFSNETQGYIRESLAQRYAHLPVMYTSFYEHTTNGDPIIRPLFYHYPDEKAALTIDDELLLGRDVLAIAISAPNVTSQSVYLPGDTDYWYQMTGDEQVYQGGQSRSIDVNITFSPVFYRAGGIVPRKDEVRKSATDMIDVPFTLHVMLNKSNSAEGKLYVDDYESFLYETEKKFVYVRITYNDELEDIELSSLDESADSDGFDLNISSVIVYSLPEEGTGPYKVTSYTHTHEGIPLKDVDFRMENKASRKIRLA